MNHKHKLYKVLEDMKSRCYNPNNRSYHRYGKRGIHICDHWLNDFRAFITWGLLNGWKEGLQIDRIDNDGNYEPNNCRFVTPAMQARNRCTNVLTQKQVNVIRTIKKNCPQLTQRAAGRMFGLSHSNINYIWNNKSWKENA